jgi:hypothetical protein
MTRGMVVVDDDVLGEKQDNTSPGYPGRPLWPYYVQSRQYWAWRDD